MICHDVHSPARNTPTAPTGLQIFHPTGELPEGLATESVKCDKLLCDKKSLLVTSGKNSSFGSLTFGKVLLGLGL